MATRLSRDERVQVWERVVNDCIRNKLSELPELRAEISVWRYLEKVVGTERAEWISRRNFNGLVRQSTAYAKTEMALMEET